MSFIETINEENATGKLEKVYKKIAGARGGVANVMKIHSLNPRAMEDHFELYKTIMFRKSELSRTLREMIGVLVSAINECEYCIEHHCVPLRTMNVENDIIAALSRGEIPGELDEKNQSILYFSKKLTLQPKKNKEAIEVLKKVGWGDSAVLDATMVCAYFNFVNRIVLALGASMEENFEDTCKNAKRIK